MAGHATTNALILVRPLKGTDMTSTTPSTDPARHADVTAPTTHRSQAAQAARVSNQWLARTAGVMYLITIVASIPAQFVLYHPVLGNPEYVLGAGHDTRVMWGGLLELITALACIGTAVALFPVVRRHHETARSASSPPVSWRPRSSSPASSACWR